MTDTTLTDTAAAPDSGRRTARELLANSHNYLASGEVWEITLALADVVEAQHRAIRAVERRAESARALADQVDRIVVETHRQICRAQALFNADRNAEARKIVAALAARVIAPLEPLDPVLVAAARHPALPRILFDPTAAPGDILVD